MVSYICSQVYLADIRQLPADALIAMKNALTKTVPLSRMWERWRDRESPFHSLASDEASYVAVIELFIDGGVAQI